MSILIKDMSKKDFEEIIKYARYGANNCMIGERAEVVELPSHGRLIDEQWLKDAMITTLEALKKNPKMDRQEMHLIAAFDTLRCMVEDAPTIIEAEEVAS